MAQQVAVVDRAQAEVLEQVVARGSIASLSLRAWLATSAAVSSAISPASWPAAIDCENEWMSWLATSLSMNVASRRAARRL